MAVVWSALEGSYLKSRILRFTYHTPFTTIVNMLRNCRRIQTQIRGRLTLLASGLSQPQGKRKVSDHGKRSVTPPIGGRRRRDLASPVNRAGVVCHRRSAQFRRMEVLRRAPRRQPWYNAGRQRLSQKAWHRGDRSRDRGVISVQKRDAGANFGTWSTVAARAAPRNRPGNDPYPEDLRGHPYRHRRKNIVGRCFVVARLPEVPFLRSLMISGSKIFPVPITPL